MLKNKHLYYIININKYEIEEGRFMDIDAVSKSVLNNANVPYTGSESYIFVSYSHKDSEAVLPIIGKLIDSGYRVWFDRGIRAGKERDVEIANRVLRCGYFIAAISNNYLASSNCQDELNYARDKDKKRFLIYLETVELPPEMEMRLTRVQNIHKYSCGNETEFYSRLFDAEDINMFRNNECKETKSNKKTEISDSWEQYSLGYSYEFGEGVEQNYTEAVKWYKLSAAQGNAWAQNRLGECYRNGNGVALNYVKAIEMYVSSAAQGNKTAECNLGICYFEGHGVKRDYKKAVEVFSKVAEQGNSEGQKWLGYCYQNGYGVNQDYKKAVELYSKSAEQGSSWAQGELGYCYFNGYGVNQDYEKAVELFSKAVEQGDSGGQKWLGYCYQNGYGVEKNFEKALELYKLAAVQGDEWAKNELKKMNISEFSETKNPE